MNSKGLTLAVFCQITALKPSYVLYASRCGHHCDSHQRDLDTRRILRGVRARRLQRDLELDLQGVALVLDLCD
ncbi:MAG: hypothetical protein ACI8PP_000086 [Candidatus Pseudothioglobus sp.]|jgi:hypothetical protein